MHACTADESSGVCGEAVWLELGVYRAGALELHYDYYVPFVIRVQLLNR